MTALRAVAPRQGQANDDDREVLLGLARAWTDTLNALEHAGGLSRDRACEVLFLTAREYMHPAARASAVFLMPQLVEATERVAQLNCGELDPADVVTAAWGGSRFEVALAALERDVDAALQPLLLGTRGGAR